MEEMLSLNTVPSYMKSSFRRFYPGEHHINRIISWDVLILMLDGTLCFEEEGMPRALTAGEWYIQRSHLYQTGIVESESPYYFYIEFSGDVHVYKNRDVKEALPLHGKFHAHELMPLLQSLDQLERSQLFYGFKKEILFLQILDKLNDFDIIPEASPINDIVRYLSEHFSEKLDFNVLSSKFGYSHDHIIRLMQQHLSVTPHKYMLNLRINYAKQLLSSTNRTIAVIAEDCGFADTSTFYRAFQQRVGMSPGKFRKSIINDLQ